MTAIRLGGEPTSASPIREQKYDPNPATDTARRNLAYILLVLLVGIVALSFVVLMFVSYNPPDGRDGQAAGEAASDAMTALDSLLKLVFAPVVGLVGSVLGFYFGGRTAKEAASGDEGRE